jgi:fructokinase
MKGSASSPRMIAAGYTTLDTILYKGRLAHRAGGTAANVAAILAWLGWQTGLAAQIGDDPAGRRLAADLKRAGVEVGHVIRQAEAKTPQIIHEVTNGGHRFLLQCPECGRRFARSRPLSVSNASTLLGAIEKADVFFFDRANAGTLALAESFNKRGALIVFEPSVPGRTDYTRRAVKLASIVKMSEERQRVLDDEFLGTSQNQIQIITRGNRGAVVRRGHRVLRETAAFPVRVIDPGGAGDWTTAGVLFELKGRNRFNIDSLTQALRFGQALAALNCEGPGARSLIEHRSRKQAIVDARRLLRAAPRRDDETITPRWSRRRTNACFACLGPADQSTS